MNLNENIQRIKLIFEYIDIPLKKNDENGQNNEPAYDPINQENRIVNTFTGDILKLKEVVQKLFPNQNLKYVGAGAMGIAFEPKGDLILPSDFTSSGFEGNIPPKDTKVIIKITTNQQEIKKIRNLINNYKGQTPGAVNYYWMKEVDLPSDRQWSTTIGAPRMNKLGHTKQERIEDFKQMFNQEWFRNQYPNESQEQIDKRIDSLYQNFIELKKKKDEVKSEKMYVICLDKVEPLSQEQKDAVMLGFEYYFWLQFSDKRNKGQGYKPEGVMKSIYLKEPKLQEFYIKKKEFNDTDKSIKYFPDFENFKITTINLINAISEVWKGPDRPRDYDLHSGNIGIKNGNLVFFDMYA